jgi:hypothetical protein
MTTRLTVRFALTLLVAGMFAVSLSAQDTTQNTTQNNPCCAPQTTAPTTTGGGLGGEFYVNSGGIWPQRMDEFGNNKIKAQGVYGLKGGVLFGGNAELEGSFEYLNHFEPSRRPNLFNINTTGGIGQPSILGFMYDVNGVWNFGKLELFGSRFSPYVVAGGGGLTAEVRHGRSAFLDGGGFVLDASGSLVPNPGPTKIIRDGATFFTVNYGGGVKFMNLWGPLGARADVRGRTIANFYSTSPTWLELTGGVLFSFGER